MALNVIAVTLAHAHASDTIAGVQVLAVRDLAVIYLETEYDAITIDDVMLDRYRVILAESMARGPVLPAPAGLVFRSADAVQRWVELHYSALTDALSFVDNRVAARVHVRRAPAIGDSEDTVDHTTAAMESLRVLRRAAVATLPLRSEKAAGVLSSSAFLIDELSWKDFAAEVEAQAKMLPAVAFELTGPWPAFDFVQMQLGG